MDTSDDRGWSPPRARLVALLCIFLLGANVFDMYHTLQLNGTHAQEANPIMRFFIAAGPLAFWTVKTVVPILASASCAAIILHPRAPMPWRRGLWYALCFLMIFYAFIISNLIHIYVRILYPSLG